jgi:AI-2 transport protein TqsA
VPPPARLPASDLRVQTTCLLVLTALAVGYTLYVLRGVVVPFVVAVALVYTLSPVVSWLARRGCGPVGSVAGAFLIALLVLTVFGGLVAACVQQLSSHSGEYLTRVKEQARNPVVARALGWLGVEVADGALRLSWFDHAREQELVRALLVWFQGLIADTFLVLTFALFVFMGRGGKAPAADGLLADSEVRVRTYLVEVTGFSALTGLLVGLILAVLGVDFALVFGFLAFVLNFIPTLGPIVATLLPVPVIVFDQALPVWAKVLAVALPAAVQVVVGNIIQPRFQSKTQGLHPVATIFSLLVFGTVWGRAGAVLAVPLTGVLRIALEQIPAGRPFAALLAGNFEPGGGDESGPEPDPPPIAPPAG